MPSLGVLGIVVRSATLFKSLVHETFLHIEAWGLGGLMSSVRGLLESSWTSPGVPLGDLREGLGGFQEASLGSLGASWAPWRPRRPQEIPRTSPKPPQDEPKKP